MVSVLVVGTAQPDAPGARELVDAVRAEQLFECVDVLGTGDNLERDRAVGEVDDLGARDARRGEDVRARAGRRRNGDERELAFDGVLGAQLAEAYGCAGFTVDNDDDLESTLAAALASGRTAVVDARCDPNENCYPMVPAGAAAVDVREAPEPEVLPA